MSHINCLRGVNALRENPISRCPLLRKLLTIQIVDSNMADVRYKRFPWSSSRCSKNLNLCEHVEEKGKLKLLRNYNNFFCLWNKECLSDFNNKLTSGEEIAFVSIFGKFSSWLKDMGMLISVTYELTVIVLFHIQRFCSKLDFCLNNLFKSSKTFLCWLHIFSQ